MAIKGELTFPGDKSISHRALLFAALTDGECIIDNLSIGDDVESTRRCLQACGITSTRKGRRISITGGTFKDSSLPLDCGNSGTTARLLMGLLAGQGIAATLRGDESLSQRPMKRVVQPLQMMGAEIKSNHHHLPIHLASRPLRGIEYTVPVASAQVKSAILFAGLGAEGKTTVIERKTTRDHTEIMLRNLGVDITVEKGLITVNRLKKPLKCFEVTIPGDPSTAAFFAAAATVVPQSDLVLKQISANPTRMGFYRALKKMGAGLEWFSLEGQTGELVGDLRITPKPLRAISISSSEVPQIIDEIPILAVLATQAEGVTRVRGAAELRVKESDRIHALCLNLNHLGAKITELEDGFIVEGPTLLKGGRITTFNDHRIAMAFTITGLITSNPVELDNSDCIDISSPEFTTFLKKVSS